jgi:hypothetical protein
MNTSMNAAGPTPLKSPTRKCEIVAPTKYTTKPMPAAAPMNGHWIPTTKPNTPAISQAARSEIPQRHAHDFVDHSCSIRIAAELGDGRPQDHRASKIVMDQYAVSTTKTLPENVGANPRAHKNFRRYGAPAPCVAARVLMNRS